MYFQDVIKLLETIKFRDKKDYFQDTLANELKKINSSDKMFVFVDKTRNIYETSFDMHIQQALARQYYKNI